MAILKACAKARWQNCKLYMISPLNGMEYLPIELARLMGRYSCALNREISLYITRDGEIIDITVGDTASVPLCDIRLRRSARRLSCVRCVHTHPRGSAELSDVDITALKSLLLDSMCALGVSTEGEVTGVQAAFLLHERVNGEPQPVCTSILSLRRLPQSAWMDEIVLSDQRVMQGEDKAADDAPERALLVGIESDESLDELADLAESAGAGGCRPFLPAKNAPGYRYLHRQRQGQRAGAGCAGVGSRYHHRGR